MVIDDFKQILFMNKTDILDKKIKHGAQVKDHISEYDGDNDPVAVASCRSCTSVESLKVPNPIFQGFRRIFKGLFLNNNGTTARKFVAHFTNVTVRQLPVPPCLPAAK